MSNGRALNNSCEKMSRRGFLKAASLAAGGVTVLSLLGREAIAAAIEAATASSGKKPNVLLILADDLGYETLGCDGGTSYKTPNLDKLAAGGVRFDNCFCTPLCSPSRVQLMSGQYGFRTGWTKLIQNASQFIDSTKVRTFAHVMKDAGYATAIAGKWQLADFSKHPDSVKDCGFDEYCMWTWLYEGRQRDRYWNPSIFQNGKLLPNTVGKYGDDIYSQFLIDFMKRSVDKSQPFLAYYPMCLVHFPFHRPPNSGTAAEAVSEDKPMKEGPAASGAASQPKPPAPTSAEAAEKRNKIQGNFVHMMEYMDYTVGRLVESLDKMGVRDNTLIIFTGDNGTDRPITSMMGDKVVHGGKGTMLDTGTHVPLIVNWKGTAPAGAVRSDLVDFSDVMPTLCALTGAKSPAGPGRKLDGTSFAPQILGKEGTQREWVFSQLGDKKFVRTKQWKLHQDGKLYDIAKDPQEAAPIPADSSDPQAAAARKRLQAVLDSMKE